VTAAVVAALISVATRNRGVDGVCAVLLILVFPGAVLATLSLRRRWVSILEQIFWAVGLSIVVSIGLGLLLDAFWQFDRWPWIVVSTAWVLLIGIVGELADVKRRVVTGEASASPPADKAHRGSASYWVVAWLSLLRSNVASIALIGASIVILVGAFFLTQSNITSTQNNFMQLSILPQPFNAGSLAQRAVVAVGSYEPREVTATVRVTTSGTHQSQSWTIRVPPGGRWSKQLSRDASGTTVATITYEIDGHTTVRSVDLAAAFG
jgi:hypothetical protein